MKFTKIIALVSVLLLLSGLTSCASPAKTPEDAAENFLSYFADQKYSTAFEYVENYDGFGFDNRDESGTKKIIDAVAKSTSFEIVGKTDSETPVEVVAKVTSVDLRELYKACTIQVSKDMFSDSLSSDKTLDENKFRVALVDAVAKAAAEGNAQKTTTDVTFKMEETDGKWFIVMDDLTLNNFCGHLNEANQWLSDTLSGKVNEEADNQSEEQPSETSEETSSETAEQ